MTTKSQEGREWDLRNLGIGHCYSGIGGWSLALTGYVVRGKFDFVVWVKDIENVSASQPGTKNRRISIISRSTEFIGLELGAAMVSHRR